MIFVGYLGWCYEKIFEAIRPLFRMGDTMHFEGTTFDDQRVHYSNALSPVFPSY